MLNLWIGTGRMKAKPDLRVTKETGKSVCSFTLAVGRDMMRGSGEQDVDWINCVAWGSLAEQIATNFDKGRPITVFGRMTSRAWEDIHKQTRVSMEVVVDRYYYTVPEPNREREQNEAPGSSPSRPQARRTARFTEVEDLDGLPF